MSENQQEQILSILHKFSEDKKNRQAQDLAEKLCVLRRDIFNEKLWAESIEFCFCYCIALGVEHQVLLNRVDLYAMDHKPIKFTDLEVDLKVMIATKHSGNDLSKWIELTKKLVFVYSMFMDKRQSIINIMTHLFSHEKQ